MKIKDIYIIGVALLLAGCSNETELTNDTLSGGEKTPLLIETTLSNSPNNGVTRAAGMEFASGDKLLAYIRHITNTDADVASYAPTIADQAPRLVTFTKGTATMADANANDGIKETTDLTASYTSTAPATVSALYWDDFSNSSSTTTDLRTENHGLQSYYGYCYNGGTPTVGLDNHADSLTNGTIKWTIVQAQSSTEIVQKQDLLWSPRQKAITYKHSTARTANDHGTLTIPYSHAMSEITVTLTAGTGFSGDDNPLANTALTLNDMNTVVSLQAPDTTITSSGTATDITMYGETYTTGNLTRNYTAIIAPKTKLKVGDVLLNIVNVDGNNYELKVTDAMLATDKWTKNHTNAVDKGTDGGNTYILTKPGYNYHLDITVNKTEVSVLATIQDWTTVNATGTGDIQFDNDVVTMNVTGGKIANASTFKLYYLANSESTNEPAERTNDLYDDLTTVSTYDKTNIKWTNSPTIYWPNKDTNYYFRALAYYNSKVDADSLFYSTDNTTVSQGTIGAHSDILWGTTPAHTGSPNSNSFTEGQAIPPRTGDVPIAFEHAMSKIKFLFTTTNDATVEVTNAKVDTTGVRVVVSNILTQGTISIETGTITGNTNGSTSSLAQNAEYCVIPQDFENYATDAKVTITLSDGTTYSLKLKECLDDQETPVAVTEWERGKFYVYTIHLEKEAITFRALIKDWVEATGSGNANLEWD